MIHVQTLDIYCAIISLKFEISMKFHKFNELANNDEFQNDSRQFIRCLNFQINKSNPNIVPNITNSISISILDP